MQGSKTAVLNLYDQLMPLRISLVLWKTHEMKHVFVVFNGLSSVTRANDSINITSDVTEH